MATVWNVLLQSLQTQSPAAVTILEMLAFLDPDNVPRELLEEEEMGNATFDQAIYALSVYSLVATVSGSLSIHRLLQDVVRAGLQQQGEDKARLVTVLRQVDRLFLFKYDDIETWKPYTPYVPHVQAVVDHAERLQVEPEITIELLNRIGSYFQRWADYQRAVTLMQRGLQLAEKHYGDDALEVAIRANNLGFVLMALGQFLEAKALYERALFIGEKTYGKNHSKVALRANNLGMVYRELGQFQEAKALFERALLIDERTYGKNH